jgi:hypothetical protein
MRRTCAVAIAVAAACSFGTASIAQDTAGTSQTIVLLVDSSTATAAMINHFRTGLRAFLDDVPDGPEMAIISTGRQLRIRVAPTRDRAALAAAADSFSPDGGGNAFLNSLLEADRRFLRDARRPTFVILATDSGPTEGGEPRIDAYNRFAQDFQARGGRAHAIVIGGARAGITTQIAENLAVNTRGTFELIGLASAVPQLMKTLAARVVSDN